MIAVAKSADLVIIVLDALREQVKGLVLAFPMWVFLTHKQITKEKNHKAILERELRTVGLRLNQSPPQITFKKKATGGIVFTATCQLTKLGSEPQVISFVLSCVFQLKENQSRLNWTLTI